MMSMTNQSQPGLFPANPTTTNMSSYEGVQEGRIMKKIKESPILPLATVGFLGIAGYRVWQAKNRGGQKLSFFLIHTRLAAQGFGVAVLGSLVLYSLGERAYNYVMHKKSESES